MVQVVQGSKQITFKSIDVLMTKSRPILRQVAMCCYKAHHLNLRAVDYENEVACLMMMSTEDLRAKCYREMQEVEQMGLKVEGLPETPNVMPNKALLRGELFFSM
jgi:hypothetical protein